MAVRLVVPDDHNDIYGSSPVFGRLRERCDVTIYTSWPITPDEVVERIKDAEIIVANRERTPLNASVLARAPKLRLIAQTGNNLVPAYYMMLSCAIGALALLFVTETAGTSLRGRGIPGQSPQPGMVVA